MPRGRKVVSISQEPKLIEVDDSTQRLFNELIAKIHTHLEDAEMKLLFRTDPKWSKNHEVSAGKGIFLFLSKINFTIIINRVNWNCMSVKTKYAFVDMILCSCGVKVNEKGDKTWFKRKPDIEGYKENYERWGEWTTTYQDFVRITKQLQMFECGGAIELAREAVEMRDLDDYYRHIDSVYKNEDAFPIVHELPEIKQAVNA